MQTPSANKNIVQIDTVLLTFPSEFDIAKQKSITGDTVSQIKHIIIMEIKLNIMNSGKGFRINEIFFLELVTKQSVNVLTVLLNSL